MLFGPKHLQLCQERRSGQLIVEGGDGLGQPALLPNYRSSSIVNRGKVSVCDRISLFPRCLQLVGNHVRVGQSIDHRIPDLPIKVGDSNAVSGTAVPILVHRIAAVTQNPVQRAQ